MVHKVLRPTFRILWEALILPSKNWRLILSIYLISILASSILGNLIDTVFLFILDLDGIRVAAVTAATIYAIHVTQIEQHLTPGKLIENIKGMLEGPLITQAYVNGLRDIYKRFWSMVLSFMLSSLQLFTSDARASLALTIVVSVVQSIWYIHLRTLFSLSVTVSVVDESGSYGFRAFRRANQLIKGNRWTGALLNFLAFSLTEIFWPVIEVPFPAPFKLWMRMVALNLALLAVRELLQLLELAVATEYYYECKRSHEKKIPSKAEPATEESDFGYTLLPDAASDNAEFNAGKLP